jgi:hypothetical protein
LSSPQGAYVLVLLPDGRNVARRPVQIGRTHQAATAVLTGLSVDEPVVIANAFFLDAERRLRPEGAP